MSIELDKHKEPDKTWDFGELLDDKFLANLSADRQRAEWLLADNQRIRNTVQLQLDLNLKPNNT